MDKANFKVIELIGEGGQAKVYKISAENKEFALKIFRHEKHFRREISRLFELLYRCHETHQRKINFLGSP